MFDVEGKQETMGHKTIFSIYEWIGVLAPQREKISSGQPVASLAPSSDGQYSWTSYRFQRHIVGEVQFYHSEVSSPNKSHIRRPKTRSILK